MKLKKIASLALAGIMAVSMLAGCGEGTGNNANPPASSEQTTSNVVSVVKNAIARENAGLTITVAENSTLNAAMDKFNANPANVIVNVLNDNIVKVLDAVFGTTFKTNGNSFAGTTLDGSLNANTLESGDKTWKYAIYTNGKITADACRTMAANDLASALKDVTNVFDGKGTNNGNTVMNNSYTLYLYEGTVQDASENTVPYIIAVLKAETNKVGA